ncbi:MAG TPA: hypothetical protein VGE45_13815 [Chloroflexia bacterium]
MSFRQNNKKERADRLKWDSFRRANWDLIESIGLPITTIETLDRFYDLLMHGCIDHHDDPLGFTVDRLEPERHQLLKELVERYFEAGFHDPGLGVFDSDEHLRLAKKYPKQFSPRYIDFINEHEKNEAQT